MVADGMCSKTDSRCNEAADSENRLRARSLHSAAMAHVPRNFHSLDVFYGDVGGAHRVFYRFRADYLKSRATEQVTELFFGYDTLPKTLGRLYSIPGKPVVQNTNQAAGAVRPVSAPRSRFAMISVPPGLKIRRISASVFSGRVKWITRLMKTVSSASSAKTFLDSPPLGRSR